jgi:hypothetical protein
MNLVHEKLLQTAEIYDWLFARWECRRSQHWQANLLVAVFLGSLLIIEFARLGLMPESFRLPKNHFYAVKLSFDLLLLLEVLGLVFNLASSVANSMGKQFEILSLILLRSSFKEFVHFTEPIDWAHAAGSVQNILSDALGALIIFALVSVFYAMQKHRRITDDAEELASFIAAKKLLALLLLTIFVGVALHDSATWILTGKGYPFFDVFYTILIFSDILLVLISLRYNSTYSIVFRNSGFAVATVIIRLALTAPPLWNVGIGIFAVALSIGLTYVYNNFALFPPHSEITHTIDENDDKISA